MTDLLIVKVPRLPVRKGKDPNQTTLSFRKLRLGEPVERLAPAENGWVEVKAKGYFLAIRGFVAEEHLAELSSFPHLARERIDADFKQFAPRVSEAKRRILVDALFVGLPSAGIVTPRRIAHFMAQCAHESNGFRAKAEKLGYSAQQIINVFGGERFQSGPRKGELRWPPAEDPNATAFALDYAYKPELFANYAYAWKNGNGGPETGDGYLYRGRGYIQLTGRGNYKAVGDRIGIDIEAEPDRLIKDDAVAMLSACCFWAIADDQRANKPNAPTLNELADGLDVRAVTRPINRKAEGLKNREQLFADAQRIWRDPDAPATATESAIV